MLGNHVKEELSAYCHGELPPERARDVASHLDACPRCRREYDEIRLGVQFAEQLRAVPAPAGLWAGIAPRLDEAEPAPRAAVFGLRSALAFAALLLVLGGAVTSLWYYQFRERLRVEAAAAPPSAFESAAWEAHRRRLAGELDFEQVSTSPLQLREWVAARIGLHVNLPDARPAEDHGRLRLAGARIIAVDGAQAALIGFELDSRPATLLTARLADLRNAPSDRWFRKDVSYRYDPATGQKALTWGSDGQAYVLISDLPGLGQQGCFLCHTSPAGRQLIEGKTAPHIQPGT